MTKAREEEGEQFIPEMLSIKGKRGPKSMLTIGLAERIFFCARHGLLNGEIAYVLGFAKKTLEKWLKSSDVFRQKFEEALIYPAEIVEQSLYNRARGMTITEVVTRESIQLGSMGKDGVKLVDTVITEKTVIERQLPPDTYAAIKWLVNRRPERWQENPTGIVQDNRQQIMINFNATEFVDPIIKTECYSKAKEIANAVRKIIGVGVESNC